MARIGGVFPPFLRLNPQPGSGGTEEVALSATLTGLSGSDVIVQPRNVAVIVERGASLTDIYTADERKIGVTEGRSALVTAWEASGFDQSFATFTLDDGSTTISVSGINVTWIEEYTATTTTLITQGGWAWNVDDTIANVKTSLEA